MILNNYLLIAKAMLSKKIGKGKYYRKSLFSTKRILEKNYKKNQPFSFLQVGANDGISFDFLFDFVINRDSEGVVIEPIKDYFQELNVNYKKFEKIQKFNKAIHRTEKQTKVFKIDSNQIDKYPDWVKGIASFDITNITKFSFIDKNHIKEEVVECDNLMNIVLNSNIKYFDYFQIDTEGYDFQILDMFDFSMYQPKLIKAEFVNLPIIEMTKLKQKLKKNGYFIFMEGNDIVGLKINELKL